MVGSARTARRIAVIIPVYNAYRLLLNTLSSIDRCDVEVDVVIVDDGSDPPVEGVGGRANCTVLRLPQNEGIEHALNHGLEFALTRRCEYIARIDAGDEALPERFSRQARFLDEHPDHGLVGSHVDFVGPSGALAFRYRLPTSHAKVLRFLRYNNPFIHSAVMIRASALRRVGGYTDRFEAAEDYDLFWRLTAVSKTTNLDAVLTRVENNPRGISLRKRRTQLVSRMRVKLVRFDLLDIHSYVGLIKDVILLGVPTRWLQRFKEFLWR